jgi:DNA recombination-dependent growth factor C
MKQIEGFFLEFDEKEIKEVREELERLGYTTDCAGLKEMVMDSLFNDDYEEPESSETSQFIKKARDFIAENPATVKLGMDTIGKLAGMIGKRSHR